jgi:hypothetical protein
MDKQVRPGGIGFYEFAVLKDRFIAGDILAGEVAPVVQTPCGTDDVEMELGVVGRNILVLDAGRDEKPLRGIINAGLVAAAREKQGQSFRRPKFPFL